MVSCGFRHHCRSPFHEKKAPLKQAGRNAAMRVMHVCIPAADDHHGTYVYLVQSA